MMVDGWRQDEGVVFDTYIYLKKSRAGPHV